ncbi:MAG: DUF2254 domain-containing protein [Nocardioidaceae bacterium]
MAWAAKSHPLPLLSWSAGFQFHQHMRQSLWAVPLVGTFVGLALAGLDLWLEPHVDLPTGWTYSASAASSILTAVAAAMVGLVGLVVTVGVLVVQMATGTLSPRFMRLWYRDRLQKLVLASFTATCAFAYALLREAGSGQVPNLGVTIAGVAVTVDLVLLLMYLDRFVHALRPVAVGAAMGKGGLAVAARIERELPATRRAASFDWVPSEADLHVLAYRSGAIQAIHTAGLVRLAEAAQIVCVFRHTVGDFVTRGGTLVDVYGPASPEDARRIRGMIAIGHERTIDQDPAFALRIMVDIAIRALSPAVNDPTTATQMLNHIGVLLYSLGSRESLGNGVREGSDGEIRLAVPTRSWDDYLELAVTEIRQYGATSLQVCRRLRAVLLDLESEILPGNQPAVLRQLFVLDRTVDEAFPDEDDRRQARVPDRQGIGGASRQPGGRTMPIRS